MAKHGESGGLISKQDKIGLTIIGVAALLFGPMLLFGESGAGDTATAIVKQIQRGECAQVYNQRVINEVKAFITVEQWNEACGRFGPVIDNSLTRLEEVEITQESGDFVAVPFTVDGTDGNPYRLDVILTRENGEWKMADLQSRVDRSGQEA